MSLNTDKHLELASAIGSKSYIVLVVAQFDLKYADARFDDCVILLAKLSPLTPLTPVELVRLYGDERRGSRLLNPVAPIAYLIRFPSWLR